MVVQSWAALAGRHFPDYRNVSRPRQMVGGAVEWERRGRNIVKRRRRRRRRKRRRRRGGKVQRKRRMVKRRRRRRG